MLSVRADGGIWSRAHPAGQAGECRCCSRTASARPGKATNMATLLMPESEEVAAEPSRLLQVTREYAGGWSLPRRMVASQHRSHAVDERAGADRLDLQPLG